MPLRPERYQDFPRCPRCGVRGPHKTTRTRCRSGAWYRRRRCCDPECWATWSTVETPDPRDRCPGRRPGEGYPGDARERKRARDRRRYRERKALELDGGVGAVRDPALGEAPAVPASAVPDVRVAPESAVPGDWRESMSRRMLRGAQLEVDAGQLARCLAAVSEGAAVPWPRCPECELALDLAGLARRTGDGELCERLDRITALAMHAGGAVCSCDDPGGERAIAVLVARGVMPA